MEPRAIATSTVDHPQVSAIRGRDLALSYLVPNLIGHLWEWGRTDGLGTTAPLDGNGSHIHASPYPNVRGVWLISVYVSIANKLTKVLSLYVTAHPTPDPRYRFLDQRCSVLGWHRGTWEDHILDQPTPPRTIEQLAATGLTNTIGSVQ
jgi:hypothetical protein